MASATKESGVEFSEVEANLESANKASDALSSEVAKLVEDERLRNAESIAKLAQKTAERAWVLNERDRTEAFHMAVKEEFDNMRRVATDVYGARDAAVEDKSKREQSVADMETLDKSVREIFARRAIVKLVKE